MWVPLVGFCPAVSIVRVVIRVLARLLSRRCRRHATTVSRNFKLFLQSPAARVVGHVPLRRAHAGVGGIG